MGTGILKGLFFIILQAQQFGIMIAPSNSVPKTPELALYPPFSYYQNSFYPIATPIHLFTKPPIQSPSLMNPFQNHPLTLPISAYTNRTTSHESNMYLS